MICNPYDVVVVPFPFADRRRSKRRPALAISSEEFSAVTGHTLLAMITSADNAPWPMDVAIDAEAVGLAVPSKVRMKLFTLDNRLILRKAGTLSRTDQRTVSEAVRRVIGS